MLVALGKVVAPGEYVFMLQGGHHLSSADQRRLSTQLSKALDWENAGRGVKARIPVGNDGVIDRTLEKRQRRFESDVANLVDAMIGSALGRDRRTFDKGLRPSTGSGDASCKPRNRFSTGADPPLSNGGPSTYGQEWQLLLDSISRVSEAMRESSDQRFRIGFVDMLFDCVSITFERGQYPASRNLTSVIAHVWDDIVRVSQNDNRPGGWVPLDGEYLLCECASRGALAARLDIDPSSQEAAALVFCQPYANMVRA